MVYFSLIDKWDKESKKIDTDQLISLCEIGDDYQSFCDDLEELIQSERNNDLVKKAYDAMQGKFFLGVSRYQSFIEKHKKTIEVMDKYHCLSNFTLLSYDTKGKRKSNLDEDYFYQYIKKHQENKQNIRKVALKLKKIGFDTISLGENIDFTKSEFELDTSYGCDFAFLENMEVVPTYLNSPIRYKTNNSCYCMCLAATGYGSKQEISKYGKKINLNSLIFDPDKLPDELTSENTIHKIKKLAEDKNSEHKDIRNSVDLSISTSDFKEQFEHLQSIAKNIDKVKNNKQLLNILIQIEKVLPQLQSFGETFESSVIDSNPCITDEIMKKEKKLYLDRRFRSSIDID